MRSLTQSIFGADARNCRFSLSRGQAAPCQVTSISVPCRGNALNAELPHQLFYRAAGHVKPLPTHLVPEFAHAIYPEVLVSDALHLATQNLITLGAIRRWIRITVNYQMLI